MNGLILINKPPGITSFQVLTPLKKTLSPAKVGHAGTLDKFAEGLLVVLAGRYTRLVSLFTRLEKEY
ncbi:MAG TPA: tRNA pseudouridine(55) synthase, partial [Spirochaetia bacterium]|nr:tRNA pseudouridine(55) synthase [Spirochaetia bacterium]